MKWDKMTIEEICRDITSGGTPSRKVPEYFGGSIPWVKTTEIKYSRIYDTSEHITELGLQKSSAKLIPANSVLIAMYGDGGTAGRCSINKVPVTTNQACCNLIIDKEVADYEFVYYYMQNQYATLVSLKSGGGQQNLNGKTIREMEIILPPLPLQHRIASILSGYDDLIENNLRRIKLLEDAAMCEYKMLIDKDGKEYEIGELVKWVKGKKPKDISQEQLDGYLPYLVFDTIEGNAVTYAHTEKVPFSSIHDVLMCMDGARSGVVFRGMEGVLGSTFATLKLEESALTEYVYQFLHTNLEYIVQGNVGAAIPHANKEYINSMKISVPADEELEEYNLKVRPLVILTANLKAQNAQLRKARDILLPKLMSGEIDVEVDISTSTIIKIPSSETMAAEEEAMYSKSPKAGIANR